MLEELRAGGTYVEIAVRLGIRVGTVKFHARNMRHKLHLETREQLVAWRHEREVGDRRGALAPLALLTGYLKPALSTAVVVVVGGVAVAAGVLAYAIANTGEPLEDPAMQATGGGRGDAAASPPAATPTPTASPAAPSPTTSAPGSPGDVPPVHFWGEIPQAQQVAIRARTASIVEFFDARYGVRVPDLEVHVGADDAALDDATESAEGERAYVGFGQYRSGVLFMRMDVSAHLIERLYFHAIQDYLSQGRDWGPWWLSEGAAVYAKHLYQHARGERALDEAMASDRMLSSYTSVRLDELEAGSPTAPEGSGDRVESLAALAVAWLVRQGGEDSLISYYRQLPESDGWREAFEASFGLPFSEVYSAFARYRGEPVARRDVSGAVLGPDGKPVEDWSLGIVAYPEGARGHPGGDATDAGFNGIFTLRVVDGIYELSLAAVCRGGWVDLGWYGGESGLTASDADAAHVVVEGENVDGLVIRLPTLPDEMFPERCSYGPRTTVSGVVVGPDGQPLPNIYLTSYDPVSGVRPDNTFSGADGSFTLSLPESAAYRLDASRVCQHDGKTIGSEVGEYGVEGDVPLDTDGLLVVAREDIAGVIMRLRVVYEDPGCLVYSPGQGPWQWSPGRQRGTRPARRGRVPPHQRALAGRTGHRTTTSSRLLQRASMATRPPLSTSMYRLWLSSIDIPIKGVVSAA